MTSEAKPGCDIDGLCVHLLAAFACPHCSDVAPTKSPEAVKVTQGDRDSAANFVSKNPWIMSGPSDWVTQDIKEMRAGRKDGHFIIEAFARHREEVEKRIVDWLRGESQSLHMRAVEEAQGDNDRDYLAMLVGHSAAYASAAGEVERGDHIQENSDGQDASHR